MKLWVWLWRWDILTHYFKTVFAALQKQKLWCSRFGVFHFSNFFFFTQKCIYMRRRINKTPIMAQWSPKMHQNALFRTSNSENFPGEAPCIPPMGRQSTPSHTLPLRTKGAFKALPRLDMLFWRLLQLNPLLLQNLGRTLVTLTLNINHKGVMGGEGLWPTILDKIPWDTCVIALMFCVFKTEFLKKDCYAFLSPPPPPIQCCLEK